MKEIIKKIPLLILVCFSFFYTDRVLNFINSKSDLMMKIKSLENNYYVKEVNAITNDDTIIPGIKGKKVNINKSFDKMKEYNTFMEEYLVYDSIIPVVSTENNMDKYIISGNKSKKEVSLIITVDTKNINKISQIKNITLFINHDLLTIENINNLNNNEIYTYGNNGKYDKEELVNDNTLINSLSNNKSKYCLVKEKNNDVINICKKNNMHTIIPNIIGNYSDIKDNLNNGSIILLNNINNINSIIKYINSKGYKIVPLNILLEE